MQEIKAQGWRELGGNLSIVDHRLTLGNNDAATSVVTLRDTKPSGTPITGDEGTHGAKIWYRLSIFGRPSTTVWEELSRVLIARTSNKLIALDSCIGQRSLADMSFQKNHDKS